MFYALTLHILLSIFIDSVNEFYVGFDWENGNNNAQYRGDKVEYLFPGYTQTDEWRADVRYLDFLTSIVLCYYLFIINNITFFM